METSHIIRGSRDRSNFGLLSMRTASTTGGHTFELLKLRALLDIQKNGSGHMVVDR